MSDQKQYKTGTAFRAALEQRLRDRAQLSNRPLNALRKNVCFDRLLARIFADSNFQWLLKGGYRLEFALEKMRTTKDIDLVLVDKALLSSSKQEQAESILEIIRQIAQLDLGDFFTFDISFKELIGHATMGGARYSVIARIEGREFDTFRLDIVLAETDMIRQIPQSSNDWLGFAGINSPTFYLLNLEMQYAEKLHAYTFQWDKAENSRTKDLIDMFMLSKYLVASDTALAIKELFSVRNSHSIPEQLMPPPKSWEHNFQEYAREYDCTDTMGTCFDELKLFHTKLIEEDLFLQKSVDLTEKEQTHFMDTRTKADFDVEALLDELIKTNAFPNMKGKNLTECIALAIKESQTANTAHSNQWKALLQALLVGAIISKLDKLQK